jgi:hypothetical protein
VLLDEPKEQAAVEAAIGSVCDRRRPLRWEVGNAATAGVKRRQLTHLAKAKSRSNGRMTDLRADHRGADCREVGSSCMGSIVDYRLRAVQWSRVEIEIVTSVIAGAVEHSCQLATEAGLLRKNDRDEMAPNRERAELESQLRRLGLAIPWK